jgi:tRNA(Ile)-lysidine synthase
MGVEEVLRRVRQGRLLVRGGPVVVMLSGGQDSVCLLDVAAQICGSASVHALHVNYGLRDEAGEDERHCATLCERLGVKLDVLRVGKEKEGGEDDRSGENESEDEEADVRGEGGTSREGDVRSVGHARGNLQAWARDLRYEAARDIAERLDGLIAVGHTASDQVETILYRLAASPGRRALLGMSASEGRVVRPLLGISREQTAAYCDARGLAWREDESNRSERYARNRVRNRLVPALRTIHPAAEGNVLRTAQLLRQETELLDGLVDAELDGEDSIEIERLAVLPAALARLIVVRLAEDACGTLIPQAGDRVAELVQLGRRGGKAELHLGGLAGAVIDGGRLRMVKLPPRA